MKKQIIIIIFFIFLIIPLFSLGEGICNLDQSLYSPGQTALLNCVCSENNEKNRVGYIVFFNDDGTLLQSELVNSGDCKKSFFGDSYKFSSSANFTGNATFSLNADGTDIPQDWDDVDDIRTYFFNVSGASLTDCIIDLEFPENPVFTLGKFASIGIEVEDGITEGKLVEATCTFHMEDVADTHVFSEPYGIDGFGIKSIAGGEVTFQQQFNVDTAEPGETYLGKVYCHCSPNGTENQCYDESNGEVAGFKSCKVQFLMSTSNDDFRPHENNIISIILIYFILMCAYFFLGRLNQRSIEMDATKTTTWLTIICYVMIIVKLIALSYFTYGYYIGENISPLLQTLFIFDFILICGIIIFSLFFGVLKFSKFEDDSGKWDKKKW